MAGISAMIAVAAHGQMDTRRVERRTKEQKP